MDAATLLSGSTPASEAPRLWRRLVTLAASGLLLGLCAFTHGLVTHSLYAPPPASNTLASRTQSRGLAAPPPSTWAVPSNTRPSAAERIARAPNPSPRSGKLHLSEEQGPLWSTRVWLVLMVTTAALGLSWVLRWAQQRTFERRRPWPMECAAVMAPESHGIALFAATGAPHPGTRAPVIGVVGGGPAGFFAAIRAAQLCKGQAKVVVYEAGSDKLRKVRKSGGGRCNVMHDPFDPDKTVRRITRGDQNVDPTEPFNPAYPRGGPLLCNLMSSTFGPKDMYEWFTDMGVALKTEADGRVFPVSNDSADVIGALERAATRAGVHLHLKTRVRAARARDEGGVDLTVAGQAGPVRCDAVVFAPGSDRQCLKAIGDSLGIAVVPPVPSLFAFGLDRAAGKSPSLFAGADAADLSGLTLPHVRVRLDPMDGAEGEEARAAVKRLRKDPNTARHSGLCHQGPVVFTHQGLSGPAALRLSAFAARAIADAALGSFRISLNVVAAADIETAAQAEEALKELRDEQPRQKVHAPCPFADAAGEPAVPRRLWRRACALADIADGKTWAEVSNARLRALATVLADSRARVTGKAVNADEFVTSGGVDLRELDAKAGMAARKAPGVFFAGEVLDCDGVTGGFSFQICWSTGYAAGRGAAEYVLGLQAAA